MAMTPVEICSTRRSIMTVTAPVQAWSFGGRSRRARAYKSVVRHNNASYCYGYSSSALRAHNRSEADASGFTCHVDLFFVPRPADELSRSVPSASIPPYQQPFPSVPDGTGSAYSGPSYTYPPPMPLPHPDQSQVASTSSATPVGSMRPGLPNQEDPNAGARGAFYP